MICLLLASSTLQSLRFASLCTAPPPPPPLDALHVNVPPINEPPRRRESRGKDGGVVEVLHASVVAVLHRDLPVRLEGVRVAGLLPETDEGLKLRRAEGRERGKGDIRGLVMFDHDGG